MPGNQYLGTPLDTVRWQAKKLAAALHIPLDYARNALAKGPYQRARWSDLVSCIQNGDTTPRLQLLLRAALDPQAQEAFELIADELFASIVSYVNITDDDPISRRQIMRKVFASRDEPVTLEQVFPNSAIPHWSPVNLGPDAGTILTATGTIKDCRFDLMAVRVFDLSAYFEDDELEAQRKLGARAIPFDDSGPDIVWDNPKSWDEAARLFVESEDDSAEFEAPRQRLSPSMEEFAKWFSGTLKHIHHQQLWSDDEPWLLPLWRDGWPYLVFGISNEAAPIQDPQTPGTQSTGSDTSTTIALVDGAPVCLEHALAANLHRWPHCTSSETTLSACHLFIRPAIFKEVEDYKSQIHLQRRSRLTPTGSRFHWILSPSNKPLAQQLITKVAAAELSDGLRGKPTVTLHAKPAEYNNLKGLFIMLEAEVVGEETWFSGNMLGVSYEVSGEDCQRHYEVDCILIRLIRALGKKKVMRALNGQWIGEEQEVADIITAALGRSWAD